MLGDGCFKQPRYGVAGSKKGEYCAQHAFAGDGSTSIPRSVRAMDVLSISAATASQGAKKREFCAQHALEGMVDVRIL